MCVVVVFAVVEEERVGEETRGVVTRRDVEFEHVEHCPSQKVHVQLRHLVPRHPLPIIRSIFESRTGSQGQRLPKE